jgi:hypothetical protein
MIVFFILYLLINYYSFVKKINKIKKWSKNMAKLIILNMNKNQNSISISFKTKKILIKKIKKIYKIIMKKD